MKIRHTGILLQKTENTDSYVKFKALSSSELNAFSRKDSLYDKKNNTITGKFSSFQEFNNSDLTDQEKYELYDTSEGSLFSRLAKKTFGNNTAAYETFMKNQILSESVNKALEWEYFDPIGTVDRG